MVPRARSRKYRGAPLPLLLLLGALAAVGAPAGAGAAASPHLRPADRRKIETVLTRFVNTSVKGKQPAAGWNLVTPAFRAGTTRRDWARGDTPVYPYPARGRTFDRWELVWATRNDVGIDLILQPVRRQRKQVGAIVFGVELKRRSGRWRVDTFIPQATFAPEGQTPKMFSERDVAPAGGSSSAEPRLGGDWSLALLGLLALVPIGVIAAWLVWLVRHRRRDRELRRGRGSMPSLPARTRDRLSAGE